MKEQIVNETSASEINAASSGLTPDALFETALGASRRTVDRDWDFAHAFLKADAT